MNNSILALVFLMAGTLLTTTAVTTMVPAAYADNENEAEDNSAAAVADCDDNDVDDSDFDCFGIAVNDVELDIGGPGVNGPPVTTTETTTDSTVTDIMTNPLFNP